MPAKPVHLTEASLSRYQLPAGWREVGGSIVEHLPAPPTQPASTDELLECSNPDEYLFGNSELTLLFYVRRGPYYDNFEEQIGRSPLPNIRAAAREDVAVGEVEASCLKREAAQGVISFGWFNGPSAPVAPWDRRLGITGVVSASQSTYKGVTSTSLDVIRNGYFARLNVSAPKGSSWSIELLRDATARM
jgi:hypothetical protein